ncbi:gluconate 2-dehydrogenase subunit 3 family protein [Brevibacillus ruminantium]|uniref:Gluconate 2-dehydrogenase subunit 3 family protein n=1 Tax=Brevibacillus ruminantium TaxID=2950604 RepID=A0ABY4WF82_9BACL|nr:gluconate 2-dehydrogenase subunit 3 family protein [Brevibacillus ruminantium]USG65506.1 gluconate 2-dehydrogenase subunit 3 family protein [Brevibacillus ruminantium]
MAQTDERQEQPVSRRKFLKNSGLVLGGLVVGGVAGSLLKTKAPPAPQAAPAAPDFNQALMYFTPEQFRVVEAATERIFPEDEHGPGAKTLGAAYFIDHQLAGDWGFNSREYMQGPFYPGEATQGYQGRLKRREIFDIGIQEMNNYSTAKHQKRFYELEPNQQDGVLKAFESDEVKLTTISASGFFKMLRASTLEGVYADPLYGGNKNMDGWRMKNYPGNQMAYTQVIEQDKFVKMDPVSLRDHQHG